MGEHLDLLDFITVSGQQYTEVTFGDLQKTESVVMVPVEIVSTANGGAMIQVGDALITLAVTYVAPVPVIDRALFAGMPYSKQGDLYWTCVNNWSTYPVGEVRAWIGSRLLFATIHLYGSNLNSADCRGNIAQVLTSGGTDVTEVQATSVEIVGASASEIQLNFYITLGVEVGGKTIASGDRLFCSFRYGDIVFEYIADIS